MNETKPSNEILQKSSFKLNKVATYSSLTTLGILQERSTLTRLHGLARNQRRVIMEPNA